MTSEHLGQVRVSILKLNLDDVVITEIPPPNIIQALEKAVDYINTHEKEARVYLMKYTRPPRAIAMKVPLDNSVKLRNLDKEHPSSTLRCF
jgi:hypothetical protein